MFLAVLGRVRASAIAVAFISLFPVGWAETPKTGVVLTTSGVRPSEYWNKSDYVSLAGEGGWHVALGTLVVRNLDHCTHEVLLSANGDLEFFDVNAVTAASGVVWPAKRSDWSRIVQGLQRAGKLTTTTSAKLTSNIMTQQIGYLVRVPEPGPSHSSAQLIITIPGAEPETLPIALEVAETEPFWKNPVFSTLFGAFSGAIIGFGIFVLQQRYTREAEARKRFEEKKVEKGTELWKFFHNTYPPLVNDLNLSEFERVRNVRKTLLEESVYSLLPLDVATRLNHLCDEQSTVSSPLSDLNTLFREAFAEFMS